MQKEAKKLTHIHTHNRALLCSIFVCYLQYFRFYQQNTLKSPKRTLVTHYIASFNVQYQ